MKKNIELEKELAIKKYYNTTYNNKVVVNTIYSNDNYIAYGYLKEDINYLLNDNNISDFMFINHYTRDYKNIYKDNHKQGLYIQLEPQDFIDNISYLKLEKREEKRYIELIKKYYFRSKIDFELQVTGYDFNNDEYEYEEEPLLYLFQDINNEFFQDIYDIENALYEDLLENTIIDKLEKELFRVTFNARGYCQWDCENYVYIAYKCDNYAYIKDIEPTLDKYISSLFTIQEVSFEVIQEVKTQYYNKDKKPTIENIENIDINNDYDIIESLTLYNNSNDNDIKKHIDNSIKEYNKSLQVIEYNQKGL